MSDRRCDRCCNGTICGYRALMNPPCARRVKTLEALILKAVKGCIYSTTTFNAVRKEAERIERMQVQP